MGIAETATRSSTTEPMLVGDACAMLNFHSPRLRRDVALISTRGDAFVESSPLRAAAARPGNFISRHRSLARSCRGDWASSPDVVELAVSLWASSLRDDGGCSGIGTPRRVSGRTGRRRTYGCGAATSRSTSTARSGRRTTSRRPTTRRRRIASGRRISSRPSADRGAGRLSSN